MPGKADCNAAAIEAMEKTGVTGIVEPDPLVTFTYSKRRSRRFDVIEVAVYCLKVTKQLQDWPERSQRQSRWFKPARAAQLVQGPSLAVLLLKLCCAGR